MKWFLVILIFTLIFIPIALAQSQGFTVSSVSTSSVITKSTNPSTVYWIINTQFNGGGQAIAGTIDPDTVKNFMNGKVYTKQPLSIAVTSNDEQVFYEVTNEAISVYHYKLQTFDAPQSCPLGICYIYDNPPPCPNGTNWDILLGKSLFQYAKKRYCITKEQAGIKGVYNNPFIGFNAKIRLTVGSIFKEKIICSGATSGCDGSSVSFDDVAVATWSGSLVTGESPPNQDNFVAIKKLASNRWQIARKSTFESYQPKEFDADQKLNTVKNTLEGTSDVAKGDTEINNAISPVNQASDTLLNEDTSFTSSPFTKDDNTGKVTITLKRSLTSPNVVFRIRADWIGIVIPTGQPKILSVTANKFGSGETGTISVQVQNIGETAGTFSAMLQNCEPFIQSTTTQTSRKTLQPQDIDTITIYVSGGAISEDISKTCSVKIYDVNEPSIETTSNLTLTLEKAKICVPNKMFADGNTIKRCNNDGTMVEIVEECKYGVLSDGKGGFVCSPSPEEKSKNECNTNLDCEEGYSCSEIRMCQPSKEIKTDVLIVTSSKLKSNDDYNKVLREYRETILKEGLTSFYILIDSQKVQDLFNIQPANSADWKSVKNVLDKILDKTHAKYLFILGGVDIIPMPSLYIGCFDSEPYYEPYINTDDLYGDANLDKIPEIAIGRIPTSKGAKNSDIIVKALNAAINIHNVGGYYSSDSLFITDSCGTPPSCMAIDDTNKIINSLIGGDCSSTQTCYKSPPYCSDIKCGKKDELKNLFKHNFIWIAEHGSGYSFASHALDGWYELVSGSNIYFLNIEKNPLILTDACHGGLIDSEELVGKLTSLAFLSNGASVYIGNTNYGLFGASPRVMSEFIQNSKDNTIGDGMLKMKNDNIKNKPYECSLAVTYEIQLYGDPTIKLIGA